MTTSVLTILHQLTTAFLSQQQCLLCHQSSDKLLCRYCVDDLTLFDLKGCQYNLLNYPNISAHLEPPRYQKLVALAPYQWPISTLISQLKFGGRLIYSKALADLFNWHCLAEAEVSAITDDTLVIPMPLHSSRLRSRKYNQSLEIVRQLGLDRQLWQKEVCQRTRRTEAQTDLSAKQRRINVKNAFDLTTKLDKNHVIIFDDVVTTGATVNSLCKTLLASNPNLHIEVWCIGLTLGY